MRNMPRVTQPMRDRAGPNRDSLAAKVVSELNSGTTTVPRVWLRHIYTRSITEGSGVISLNTWELEKD